MPAGEEWHGGSGFKQLYYKLSGAETGEHVLDGPGATVTITQEGVTTLTYYSTDWAGNQGPERTLTIRIDRTPPVAR